jgi:FG-GAP-like repeat
MGAVVYLKAVIRGGAALCPACLLEFVMGHDHSLVVALGIGLLVGCARGGGEAGPLMAPAPGSPLDIAGGCLLAEDLNGDGRSDLLVVGGGKLHVLLSDGDGFRDAPGSPIDVPKDAGELALGDLNGDGKVDIVIARHDSYDIAVMLGEGGGRFAPAPGSPFAAKRGAHPHTHGLAVADFNRDGKLDVVMADFGDGDLAVLLGDGKGGLAPGAGSPFACGRQPYPIAVADLDGDGNVDVLVPNSVPADQSVRTLTVLRGNGKGGLSPAPGSPVKLAGAAFYAAAGDLNGDGRPDAVVTHNNDDGASVLLNDGHGGLIPAPSSPLKLGSNCWGVVIVDMDRDGKSDLVAAGKDAVRVFLGDGRGGLRAAPGSPFVTGKGTWRVAVGDFNGDGKLDAAATCVEEGKVAVLRGR